jgi:hypothetical protein
VGPVDVGALPGQFAADIQGLVQALAGRLQAPQTPVRACLEGAKHCHQLQRPQTVGHPASFLGGIDPEPEELILLLERCLPRQFAQRESGVEIDQVHGRCLVGRQGRNAWLRRPDAWIERVGTHLFQIGQQYLPRRTHRPGPGVDRVDGQIQRRVVLVGQPVADKARPVPAIAEFTYEGRMNIGIV